MMRKAKMRRDGLLAGICMLLALAVLPAQNVRAAENSDVADDISRMGYLIQVYWERGNVAYEDDGVTYMDTAYNADDFWGDMYVLTIYYDPDYEGVGFGTISFDEVTDVAYSLYDDYAGELPDFPSSFYSNGGVQIYDDSIRFMLATPEEHELTQYDYKVHSDGSVTVIYRLVYDPYGSATNYWYCAEYVPNDHYEEGNDYSFPYTITSLAWSYDSSAFNIRSGSGSGSNTSNGGSASSSGNTGSSSEYIFADSNSRYLTVEDLEPLDATTLRYACNEIYARHGRLFNDQDIQAYFNSKSWYHGTIFPAAFDESVFNQYERANIDLIVAYENGEVG